MKDTVINSLPNVLKKYITTLKRVSLDEAHHQEMCDSAMSVINFDKVPNEYAKGRGWMCVPKSNDALYIAENDKWFLLSSRMEVLRLAIYTGNYMIA